MSIICTEKWQGCLFVLKNRIGADRFNLWFKSVELVELEKSKVVIGVPSAFIAEWLEAKFSQDIVESIYEATGDRVEVGFRVIGSLFSKLRSESLKEGASLIQKATAPKAAEGGEEGAEVRAEFRLDNFVVGPCNQLAFAAAKEVAGKDKPIFNPLFLHGPIGIGKTHLLQGIYNEIRAGGPKVSVRYATAERFTNQYVFALKHGRLDSFRHMYRNADVFLIDDVQFFSNKMGFQEEFLHTFNAIIGNNHQVVMASDTHPHDLTKVHDGLASRFMSGLVVKLEPPQYPTRLAILKSKAASLKKQIDEEVFKLIAHLCQGNVREMEGALTSVIACASLSGGRVDVDTAKEVFRRVQAPRQRPITVQWVEQLVLQEFGLTRDSVQARKRAKSASLPRHVCMYLARKWTGMSAQEIGAYFGGRNHTTVLFAAKKIAQAVASDQQLAYSVHKIERQLQTERASP